MPARRNLFPAASGRGLEAVMAPDCAAGPSTSCARQPRGCSRTMLMLPILLSNLMLTTPVLTAVKADVWWRTPGGTVTEHRDGDSADCTLRLEGDGGSFAFIWAR